MKIKISIEQEFDINDDGLFIDDDPFLEDNKNAYDIEQRTQLLVNRFIEDIDSLVKYNEVEGALRVEYIED